MQNGDEYLFQEKLLLIVSLSCTVIHYCESKSDIYSLLNRINLFKNENISLLVLLF